MTTDPSAILIETVKTLLLELEAGIAKYPKDLCDDYSHSKAKFQWGGDDFGDDPSEIKGLSEQDLAAMHQLMFASAFAASATSLPDRKITTTSIESTAILDAVTEAGLPAREFLRHYGSYGNQFTWQLLKLTGRIRESSNQTAPALVNGA